MEKSSGSDWGESRQRRQRGIELWRVSLLPAKNNLYFLLYGLWFCSSGWVSDLTEWYQTRNRLLKVSRMSKKVCVRHPNCTQARNQWSFFFKPLELRVVVLSCTIPSGLLLPTPEMLWNYSSHWAFVCVFRHMDVCWHVRRCTIMFSQIRACLKMWANHM